MATTMSSNYDKLRTLLVTTAERKVEMEKLCLAWALEACHTVVMIFADREPEWRCTAAACGAIGSTCAIRPEEWE
ncbi:Organic cation/carnitine transporter [Arachis hypogaea]|nr:Organic cation/carnitine transporter [Arachis hypogaea]